MKKRKFFRYKILFVWIIVLLFGISVESSIGNMTKEVKNYSNNILSINNSKAMISCDHIAYIISQSSELGAWEAWEFILNSPGDLTCICEVGGGSGDFFTGGCWTKDGVIITSEYGSGLLYGIDLVTCEMWSIGGGGTNMIGLAYDPITNRMFGVDVYDNIWQVDPDTGWQEMIGNLDYSGGLMVGMAYDAEGQLYGWELVTDKLWKIDPDEPSAKEVGPLGMNINYARDGDFCMEDDILYIPVPDNQPGNTFILYASDGFYYGQFPYDVYLNFLVIPWNYPPYTPSNPIPLDGATNVSGCSVEWTGGDPDGDLVYYDVYFGNTTPPPQVISNGTVNHFDYSGVWEFNTTYYWKIVSKDEHDASAEGPIWSFTTIKNNPPVAPIITGPTNGRAQVLYDYNFSIFDPEGDDMLIHIDWENGTPSKWDGPFPSGSIIKYNYSWKNKGKYTIRAQTMDSNGLLSDWGTLEVIIPRNRASYSQLLLWFLHRFPLLERFLSFYIVI